jgi:hypothetical protein
MRKWKLETWNIDALSEHPHNARYMTKEDARQLKRSIQEFGVASPPQITREGMIIGGHQRIKILKELGESEVECLVCEDNDFTPRDVDILNIRLNKNTGRWDDDILANEWDISLLCEAGFSPEYFDDSQVPIKKPKVTFEFEDSMEMKEFLENMEQFPNREGGWTYKMKVKS